MVVTVPSGTNFGYLVPLFTSANIASRFKALVYELAGAPGFGPVDQ